MTQAQSAAQKKRGMARRGTGEAGKQCRPAQKGTRLGGKPEPRESVAVRPPPPRKHSAKKRAAGFPAAHMEKDAVTPT